MLDAWQIDKMNRERQRENDRRSWERAIHAPQPEPPRSKKRDEDPQRGSTTVNFEL